MSGGEVWTATIRNGEHVVTDENGLMVAACGDRGEDAQTIASAVSAHAELVALLDDAASLMATETNRMGKPEFYDVAARAARERFRERWVKQRSKVNADTVLHQAAMVIRAVLAKVRS